MGSPLLSKKAFLYFGGAAILLLGGIIVVMAPYHYTGFIALPGDASTFDIWDRPGFHEELEISVVVNPEDNGSVLVNLRIVANVTLDTTVVNMSLSQVDRIPDKSTYEKHTTFPLEAGPYTIHVDSIIGASDVDIAFTQISDSRNYIVTGGVMNIVGLFMGAFGYCIGGSMIPSGNETIVDWGFDERQHPK